MADRNGLRTRHDFSESKGEAENIFFIEMETDMKEQTKNTRIFKIDKNKVTVRLVWVAALLICAAQQSLAQLQITSPTQGTVVNPGQALSATVTSSGSGTFTNVGVVAEDPIGSSDLANSVPAQFSLAIPTNIPCRPHMLTAMGTTSSGQHVQSETIFIDVERPDLPTSLAALLSSFSFQSLGEQVPITLTAKFSDGSVLDVTESSYVTYASSNNAVATVNRHGMVTAAGAGSATVTATYTLSGQQVQTAIPVKVRAPKLTATPTALTFGSQNVGSGSSPQQITLSNTSNSPISVIGIRATSDFAESDDCVSSSPLAPSVSCTVSISFVPTAAGPRNGGVTIANNFNIIPAALQLNGIGIGQPTTTTSLASSANPTVYGQATTLSSSVTASSGSGTPTGSVTFDDGSNALGTASLSGAQAAFTVSSLSVGTHSIAAAYSGDTNFLASTSSALSQIVNQASTVTSLTSSASSPILNTSVTLTANLSVVAPGAGTPTGTITFQEGSNVLSTSAVGSSEQATFSTASLSVGTHSLVASYSGDTNFQPSSGTFSQRVAYGVCVLYDQTRSVNSGATFPIKLYLCDASGNDVSSSAIVVHASGITNVSGSVGPVESPGSANPDNNFRFDSTQGPSGGYIFNLSTTGLATGTYSLQFTAGNDPTSHSVNFGLK